ncbi:prolipoprotein diacylglyceryl transferase [Patescibacteria group bacterium]|nr:prolipoprotein diacylglyceryl transferase [Patescibacteria group bacterium]
MENFLQFYQKLPLRINSMALDIGFFHISWYALMYLVGFAVVYHLLLWRIKKKEGVWSKENIQEFLLAAFLGVIIGGRLGYVFFYNLPFYLANPLAIISPFSEGQWTGIYGMSYHGGLIGVFIATWFFCRRNEFNFFSLADFIIPAVPAGYFFGRIGNFFNGELFGRITQKNLGMYFPGETLLRHPSQLYEAFFEGIILFLILWTLRNGIKYKGRLFHVSCFILYILGYAGFRFGIEFFRQPDEQIGFLFGFLTLGQILSLGMVLMAFLALGIWRKMLYNKGKIIK